MTKRYIPIVAVFACLSVAGAPAFATDDPPPTDTTPTDTVPADTTPADSTPSDAAPATDTPAATPAPAAGCVDKLRPKTKVSTTARTASRTHAVRGTATDTTSCTGSKSSVALVSVSISLKSGKKCKYLTKKARLSRSAKCAAKRWLSATGTKKWVVHLPRKLPKGNYQILTRAVDSAGNVERAHTRRLTVR